MKKRLKAISIILAMILALAPGFPVQKAYAAGTAITVQTLEAHPGDTVTLKVSISGNTGVALFQLPLSYDSDKLEKVSFKGVKLMDTDWTIGQEALWVCLDMYTGNGTILELTFKVKDGTSGFAAVSIGSGALVADYDETVLTVSYVSGGVNITKKPAPTEPASTEPAPTEPKPTEPKPTEPKPTEPETVPSESETVIGSETESTEEPTEPETGRKSVKSGESIEILIGEGKALISLPAAKTNRAEIGLEYDGNLSEQLLTTEELKRVTEGEKAEISISADWVSEEEMTYKNHQALETALAELQKDGSLAGVLGTLNLDLSKRIGNDAVVKMTEAEIAEALKAADGCFTLNLSELTAPEGIESELYMLLLFEDGSTKLKKITELSHDAVTVESGAVPLAVLYVSAKTEKSYWFYFIGLGIAVVVILAICLLRKKQVLLLTGKQKKSK